MTEKDKPEFFNLLAGMFAYHRQAFSPALGGIYWRGCAPRFTLDQVVKAVDTLTADPEAGKFLPKIGDITRVLEGTHADRSMLAWGKVLEALSSVGAYQDVIFDDAAIHAAVQDMGGWPKMCRGEIANLGYLQTAFCKAHIAYTGRGTFDYPRSLPGDRSPDAEFEKVGLPPPTPVLVGDPEGCRRVFEGGSSTGKTAITFTAGAALAALAMPRRESDQDVPFRMIGNAS
jgi:hypothetical protein